MLLDRIFRRWRQSPPRRIAPIDPREQELLARQRAAREIHPTTKETGK